ncbi:MAG: hypothetical protein ABWY39_03870 [Mycobacterium sp.]
MAASVTISRVVGAGALVCAGERVVAVGAPRAAVGAGRSGPRVACRSARACWRTDSPYWSGLLLRRERSNARCRARARRAAFAASRCCSSAMRTCSMESSSGCRPGKDATDRFDTLASMPARRPEGIWARRA